MRSLFLLLASLHLARCDPYDSGGPLSPTPLSHAVINEWLDLLTFKPTYSGDKGALLNLWDGHTNVGLDNFAVIADHCPSNVTTDSLFSTLLLNWPKDGGYFYNRIKPKFIDGSGLPSSANDTETDPRGSVFDLILNPPGFPSFVTITLRVALTKWAPSDHYFGVTTMEHFGGLPPHKHPVSGNRFFGVKQNRDGAFVMYTRAVDTVSSALGPGESILDPLKGWKVVRSGQDESWQGAQENMAKMMREAGCTKVEIVPKRGGVYDIMTVRNLYDSGVKFPCWEDSKWCPGHEIAIQEACGGVCVNHNCATMTTDGAACLESCMTKHDGFVIKDGRCVPPEDFPDVSRTELQHERAFETSMTIVT